MVTMAPLGSSDVQQQKRALRDEMRERRLRLSAPERERAARAASDRLVAWLAARGELAGRVVAGYVAVRGELDPAPALEELRTRGATIALPRVAESGGPEPRLQFERVEPGDPLRPGRFGIPEPQGGGNRASFSPGALEVVIAPGLAFDAAGRRLGSGGGYYDSTFAPRHYGRPPLLIGFAYDFQLVERCPADAHDLAVDLVVTERRMVGPRAAGPAAPAQSPGGAA